MTVPLSLPEAEQLAEATKAKIDYVAGGWRHDEDDEAWPDHFAADRERVESDLAGLRRAYEGLAQHQPGSPINPCQMHTEAVYDRNCADARRWREARDDASVALQLTASLYGASLPVGTPAREET